MQTHTVPSLQGTLAKPAMPTLQPNFAKEPFSPSRSNAGQRDSAAKMKDRLTGKINNETPTHNIKQLVISGLRGFDSRASVFVGGQVRTPKTQPFHIVNRYCDKKSHK